MSIFSSFFLGQHLEHGPKEGRQLDSLSWPHVLLNVWYRWRRQKFIRKSTKKKSQITSLSKLSKGSSSHSKSSEWSTRPCIMCSNLSNLICCTKLLAVPITLLDSNCWRMVWISICFTVPTSLGLRSLSLRIRIRYASVFVPPLLSHTCCSRTGTSTWMTYLLALHFWWFCWAPPLWSLPQSPRNTFLPLCLVPNSFLISVHPTWILLV